MLRVLPEHGNLQELELWGGEYYTLRGFALQPNLLNGLPSLNNGALEMANVEQVEVIKGPNGTLYGGSVVGYGGLINVITKKPHDTFASSMTYTVGSNQYNRFGLDLNTPVSESFLTRLNVSYQKENSFKDAGFKESFFVAPSMEYKINKRATLSFDFQYALSQAVHVPMMFVSTAVPVGFNTLDLFESNYKNSYTTNDIAIKNPTLTGQLKFAYDLAEGWVNTTVVSKNQTLANGYYQVLDDRGDSDHFQRFITRIDSKSKVLSVQNNLTGNYQIGSWKNKLLIGVDYLSK